MNFNRCYCVTMKIIFLFLCVIAGTCARFNHEVIDCSGVPNTEFKVCVSSTRPTCALPNPLVKTKDCIRGCICKAGFVLNEQNNCVSPTECKRKSLKIDFAENDIDCGRIPNTEFKRCQSSTQPSCTNPNPIIGTLDCQTGCFCKDGYLRNEQNQCVLPWHCQKKSFGKTELAGIDCSSMPNTEFKRCQSSTQPSCTNPNPMVISFNCQPGCFCKDGYLRNEQNQCVLPWQCQKKSFGKTELAGIDCSSMPNTEFKRCESSTQPSCTNPNPMVISFNCQPGCFCKDGYLRNEQNQCILPWQCQRKSFGKTDCSKHPNTIYKTCHSSTRPTCNNPRPKIATADCRHGCVCKNGFVLNNDKNCVRLKDCKKN